MGAYQDDQLVLGVRILKPETAEQFGLLMGEFRNDKLNGLGRSYLTKNKLTNLLEGQHQDNLPVPGELVYELELGKEQEVRVFIQP